MSSFSLWTEDHGKDTQNTHPPVHILPLSPNHREREGGETEGERLITETKTKIPTFYHCNLTTGRESGEREHGEREGERLITETKTKILESEKSHL